MSFCSIKPDILSNDSQCSDDKDSPSYSLDRPNQMDRSSARKNSEESASDVIAKKMPERREWAGMDNVAGNEGGLVDEDGLVDEHWLEATFALLDSAEIQ